MGNHNRIATGDLMPPVSEVFDVDEWSRLEELRITEREEIDKEQNPEKF